MNKLATDYGFSKQSKQPADVYAIQTLFCNDNTENSGLCCKNILIVIWWSSWKMPGL